MPSDQDRPNDNMSLMLVAELQEYQLYHLQPRTFP